MPELSIPSFLLLFYSAYALIFMEGLFLFTRPGVTAVTDPWEIITALFVAILFIWLPGLLLWVLGFTVDLLFDRFRKTPLQLCLLPSVLCLTILSVLMIDNFTYTVFKTGIIHTKGLQRYLYLGFFLIIFAAIYWRIAKTLRTHQSFFQHRTAFFAALLPLFVSIVIFLGKLMFSPSAKGTSDSGAPVKSGLPNIILFASDGIDANRLQLYGYPRNTTPKLNAFARERPPLLCENAFSNGARTTGSVTSMLTGKAPATNKVFFPPHILNNAESFRHLPGILKKLGYVNFQETIRYYADAGDLNLQDAFDVANDRKLSEPGLLGRRFAGENYFLETVRDRIRDRALHLFGIRPMENIYAQMTRSDKPNQVYGTNDDTRVDRFLKFMDEAKTPFFAHLHLLDSHCCGYKIRRPYFSARAEDDDEGPTYGDLLDDTILSSDYLFDRMLQFLKMRGLLENTLIVYSSDHNRGWTVRNRVPLMFFFPEGRAARVEKNNCQLLDIMPTIIDALGRKPPPWAEGHSLLKADGMESDRPIFGFLNVNRRPHKIGTSAVTMLADAGPPFYGLASYSMVSCNRWYELNLNSGRLSSGNITKHSGECDDDEPISNAEAKEKIIAHLQAKQLGFKFKHVQK